MVNLPNLDKITEKFIKEVSEKNGKPLYELSPKDARNFLSDLQKATHQELNADILDVEIPTEEAGTVNVRFVKPQGNFETLPLIVYCHGGGWVMGDKDVFDMTIKTISIHTKSIVAFVEYSRSPEAKYPVAINQIYGVLKYLSVNGSSYNIDAKRIAIVGDSAGGNMAAAVALMAKKNNDINLCFQALIYPVTDADMSSESYNDFENGPWLSKKAMEWFWDEYLTDKKDKYDMCVSPLKTDIKDLQGLPPALVIVAENDILRDEGEEYARKLIAAGVDTACVRINNTCHDFLMLNALRESKATKAAYKLLCKFLKHALH